MQLKDKFKNEIVGKLKKELWKKNIYQVPKLKKIVINTWIWTYLTRSWRTCEEVVENLTKIFWQKPIVINTKLSVSNFKLRQWMANWVKITLRWEKMFNFFEKLVNVVLPRIRDFRGVSKRTFDKTWNYSLWISDITVFPEINLEDISKTHWLQINFCIDAQEKAEAFELLKNLWLPFEK